MCRSSPFSNIELGERTGLLRKRMMRENPRRQTDSTKPSARPGLETSPDAGHWAENDLGLCLPTPDERSLGLSALTRDYVERFGRLGGRLVEPE